MEGPGGLSGPDGVENLRNPLTGKAFSETLGRFSFSKERGGGVSLLAEVRIQDGESLESALRRFKRKVQQEDIIKEIKKHSYFLKPGERRRIKQALARKRMRKKMRRELS